MFQLPSSVEEAKNVKYLATLQTKAANRKEKKFACDICNKTFAKNAFLQCHKGTFEIAIFLLLPTQFVLG